jgi:hypothetical protein
MDYVYLTYYHEVYNYILTLIIRLKMEPTDVRIQSPVGESKDIEKAISLCQHRV